MRLYRMFVVCLAVLSIMSCTQFEPDTDKSSETLRVPIHSLVAFKNLGLSGNDDEGRRALGVLTKIIGSRFETSTFTLAFRQLQSEQTLGKIIDKEGRALESIAESGGWGRIPQKNIGSGRCTQVFPPIFQERLNVLLHPERYRGMQCGNIATIHSAVKLGLLIPDDAFSGQYLNKDRVQLLNLFHESQTTEVGMTDIEVQEAHKSFSTPQKSVQCLYPTTARTNQATAITGLLQTLSALVNNRDRTFDCTLQLEAEFDANGKPRISHLEHVTDVRQISPGVTEIKTIDGFNQGKTDASIPSNPGSNTWNFGPNMGKLSDGNKDNMAQFGEVNFEKVLISCCWVQAR